MEISKYVWRTGTRPCSFCLCLQGGSVFADFDVDSDGRVYLVRISFDGYGCCRTDDLFAQAEMLARVDVTKPKQANLRRAVSAAYYGLFHYLVEESCFVLFGRQHGQGVYRHTLGRAFVHSVMKQACVSFVGGTLKKVIVKDLPHDATGNYVVHESIRKIAWAFAELQEKRHLADYDRNERFKRSEVLPLIEEAKERSSRFATLSDSDDRRFFLACLWAWKELSNR